MSSVPARIVSQPATNIHPAQHASPARMLTPSCANVSRAGWTGQLPRRMLHEVCRNAIEGAADAPIARHAAAADGVDHATGRVGAVLDRQSHLELDRRVREPAPLHAEEAHLVVALPGDVVARSDVDR